MPNTPIQVIDDLALVSLTQSEVANINMASLGVITITSGSGGGTGDMMKSVFATLNPAAGFVDKSLTSAQVPYTGLTTLPGGTTLFLRADGQFALPPGQTYGVVSLGGPGLVPTLVPSGGSGFYLRGDASWQPITGLSINYNQLTSIPSTFNPTLHAAQHVTGGNDVISLPTTTQTGLVQFLPNSNQSTSYLRADNTWSQIPTVTSISAGLMPSFPGSLNTFYRGDGTFQVPVYSSLAGIPSTFTPSLHANTHITGGSDVIPNFQIGGLASGLTPASPGGTTLFLRADGVWFAPTGSGALATSGGAGLLQALQPTNQILYYLGGDNFWHLISLLSIGYNQVTGVPVFAGGSAGLVPNSAGGTINFLRADGQFAQPPGGNLVTTSSPGLVSPIPNTLQTTSFLRGDDQWALMSTISPSIDYNLITINKPSTFTPSLHASSHVTGGNDIILPPTTTKSGLVPPLPSTNAGLNFLNGIGAFAQIPVATGGTSGLVPTPPNIISQWLRGDAQWQPIPLANTLNPGFVPTLPGTTTTFFSGFGNFTNVPYASLSGTPLSFIPTAHAASHITGSDILPRFSATTDGLTPFSGGGSSNFLRADGTWQTPSGAGDVSHTRLISTANSIQGGGDLSIDRTHSLVGDVASPGNFSIYSTNSGGARGWNLLTSFPQASPLVTGLVPTPTNNDHQFLSGVASFIVPQTFTATTPGYAPLSGGSASNFLCANGSWIQPPTPGPATTLTGGLVPSLQTPGASYYLRGDNLWQLISQLSIGYGQVTGVPIFSGSLPGLVPTSTGSASTFLRGDGSFQIPILASSGVPGYITGLPASNPTSFWARGDNSWQLLPDTVLIQSPWTMPPVGTTVSGILVNDTTTLEAGMTVYNAASSTFNSVMEISSVTDGTHVVLLNQGYAPTPTAGTQMPGGLMFIIGPGIMTSTKAGFVPTPPAGDATKFLSGAGTWLVPAGGGGSGTVFSQASIQGDGSVGNKLQLVSDSSTPGAFRFYSTDAIGNKGWFPLVYSWETNGSFSMPAVGTTVTISLTSNIDQTAGSTIVITDNNVPQHEGFFEVISVNVDLQHITVSNPGYAMNSAFGSVFATNATVTLAGPGQATATAPGFVPTPPAGDTHKFLRGDASWQIPSIFDTANAGYVPVAPVSSPTFFLCADGTWKAPTLGARATTGTDGAVAGLPASNQTTSVLRGDNSWVLMSTISASIDYNLITVNKPSTFPATAHASSHISTGSDAISLFSTTTTTSGLTPGSNNVGSTFFLTAIGTWAVPPSAGRATSGNDGLVPNLIASPTLQYLRGDDSWQTLSSISSAIDYNLITVNKPTTFAPSTHHATHLDNGSDPIDVVAGIRTGLVPVLPASSPTTKFLRGDATWTVIPPVSTSVPGLAPLLPNTGSQYFRDDGNYAAIPIANATTAGLVSTPPNLTYKWFRGDATFDPIPFYWQITTSFTQPATAANIAGVVFADTTGLKTGMVISTTDASNLVNYYSVSSVTDGTHAVLTNLASTGNTAAAGTVNPGSVTQCGPPIMPSGVRGAGIPPITPNDVTLFLRGDGIWAAPTASGVPTTRNVSTQFSLTGGGPLSSDLTLNLVGDTASPTAWQIYSTDGSSVRGWHNSTAFPVAVTGTPGLVPTPPGTTNTFLNGAGSFTAPASLSRAITNVDGIVPGLPVTNQLSQWLRADNSWSFLPDSNVTTGSWAMPAIGATVNPVTFTSTANWDVGMTLFFATGSGATCCFMEVDTVLGGGTQLILRNRGYASNPVATTTIPASMVFVVSPGIATTTGGPGAVPTAGLLPTPDASAVHFLSGALTYITPPTVGVAAAGYAPATGGSVATNFLCSDLTWKATPGSSPVTVGTPGTVAGLPSASPAANQTSQWLRGDDTWAPIPVQTATNATFTVPAVGASVSVTILAATWPVVGQAVWISDGTRQGIFDITIVSSSTSISIKNQGYAGNSISGTMGLGAPVVLVGMGLATATTPGFPPSPTGSTVNFLRADNSFQPIPSATSTVSGLVPTPPNNTDQWLRGDATWVQAPPLAKTITATFTWPAFTGTVAIAVDSSANMMVGMGLYFPGLGTAEVMVVTDATHVTIRNNGNSGNLGSTAGVAVGTSIYAAGIGALATTTTSGMMPIGTNTTTKFLRDDASWQTPPIATSSTPGYVSPTGATTTFYRGDGAFTILPANSTSSLGTVAASPNNVRKFYKGDSTWDYSFHLTETSADFVIPAVGSTVAVVIFAASWPSVGENVCIGDAAGHKGYYEITVVTDSTHITVRNLGTSFNTAPGSTMANPAFVRHASPGVAISGGSGLVPIPPGGTNLFLRSDATWALPSGTRTLVDTAFTWPAANGTVAVNFDDTTEMMVGSSVYIPGFGTAEVTVVTDATHATIRNNSNTGNLFSGTVALGQEVYGQGTGAKATATSSGMLPTPPNNTTTFLRGDATFSTPPSATSTVAGYVPTPPNNTTTFLRGDATFSTPPSATATVAGYVPTPPNNTTTFLRGDATFATPPSATATVAGYVPTPPNNTTTFLRGDATWTTPTAGNPYNTTSSSFTVPAINVTVNVTVAATTDMIVGQTHVITDGTLFMIGRVTTIASLVVTYTNQGGGGSVSGAMGAGHVYMVSAPAAIDNTTTHFLSGANTFITPPSATSTVAGYVPTPPNNTTTFLRGDATFATPPSATSTVAGYVPTPPNNVTTFLRGDATFATPPSATSTVAGYVPTPPNNTTTFLRGDATFATAFGTRTYSVFNALDANPPATLYGVFGTRNSIPFVAFNDTTSWNTVFIGIIPEGASLGSGLIVRIHWMGATATSGNVMWRMYFERMNTDEDADSFDTVIASAAAAANGTSGIITVTATTCTTIDGVTAGDGYRLKIDRDAANGSDTMTGDAQIVLVEVRSAA